MTRALSRRAAGRAVGTVSAGTGCVAALALLTAAGCMSPAHVAAYRDRPSGASVAIEFRPVHPTLAEYHRVLVFATHTSGIRRHRLAMDSGGYGAADLYRCPDHRLLLDSDGEALTLDTASGRIAAGTCAGPRRYLGVFDGGGSRPWRFLTAPERADRALVMRGG